MIVNSGLSWWESWLCTYSLRYPSLLYPLLFSYDALEDFPYFLTLLPSNERVFDSSRCLAWLYNRRLLRCHHRKNRGYLPHFFPRRLSSILRHLGCAVASLQSRSNGLYLVWRTSVDRRRMCHSYDRSYLALIY